MPDRAAHFPVGQLDGTLLFLVAIDSEGRPYVYVPPKVEVSSSPVSVGVTRLTSPEQLTDLVQELPDARKHEVVEIALEVGDLIRREAVAEAEHANRALFSANQLRSEASKW